MDFIWEHLISTSVEEQLPGNKRINAEVAEQSKDTCWFKKRISESQIRTLKENESWDIYERLLAREEIGKCYKDLIQLG